MNRIQSVERRNGLLARLWHQYFRMGVVLYSSITSKRARFEEERIAVSKRLHELGYELLLHPPYFPDLAPSDFFMLTDLKKEI
jgi:hypothetical protein